MREQGRSQEDIDRLAPEIANQLMDRVGTKIRDRRGSDNVSEADAAKIEAAKTTTESISAAGGGQASFSSSAFDFYDKLQGNAANKDPYQSAIANSTRMTAEYNQRMLAMMQKNSGRPNGALVGPP
jgi:hypothetical protein